MDKNILISLAEVLVFLLVLFLILRELNLWYFKINKFVGYQKEQIRLLKKIAGEKEEKLPGNDEAIKTSNEGNPWNCPKCGKKNPYNKQVCQYCDYSIV